MTAIRTFEGFKAGKTLSVQVPTPFFSDLLPLIDDLAELKVTMYCFWALQQRETKYRYVRLRDLANDDIFMAGLDEDAVGAAGALHRALDRAIARGTLLHVTVPTGRSEEHLYFMNTDKGRTAVAALQRGDWTPGPDDLPIALIAARPNIFTLYAQNIGPLTPIISET